MGVGGGKIVGSHEKKNVAADMSRRGREGPRGLVQIRVGGERERERRKVPVKSVLQKWEDGWCSRTAIFAI